MFKTRIFLLPMCFIFIALQHNAFSSEQKQPDGPIAIVNGKKITRDALAGKLIYFADTDAETMNAIKQEIIDQLITDILLEEFIDKQGLLVTTAEIEREVDKIGNEITGSLKTSPLSLDRVLASIGSNVEEFKRGIKHSLALEKYFSSKLDVKTLEKFFGENKNLFNGESIKVSHILLDTRSMKTQEEVSQALEGMKGIKRELDRGASFEELAKKHSNCPTALNGGDLGYIQRKGTLARPFLDTAFSLKVGQVSDPVKTEYGYHLIKVTDKKEGFPVKFDEIRAKVRTEALESEVIKLLDRLRKEAQIVINQ